ncbi:hypothetical protein [Massilia luteola]|uniref:hypothetical protein n=1 Tax=Massilia luteola TaxID=3081751 RepID=UPI002ACBE6BA|nr:hypothetical protein [Massilia sp. Gc5]
MMSKSTKAIIVLGLSIGTVAAHAGSPDGMSVAAIGSTAAAPFTAAVTRFFSDYKRDGISCGDDALRIERIYTTGLPRQITSELALAAAGDRARHKKLAKILTSYRGDSLDHGFDAVLAYDVKDGQLRLYGISGSLHQDVLESHLSVEAAQDQQKFNIAACKVLASLPVLVTP